MDDDGSNLSGFNDMRDYFTRSLDSLNLVYKTMDVAVDGVPDSTWLASKPVVIWFSGNQHSPLTSEAVGNLEQYLEHGGRLLITGQYLGDNYDQYPEFFENYLGGDVTGEDANEDYVFGEEGAAGFTSQDRFLIHAADGAHNQNGTDIIQPYGEGSALFYYPFLQSIAGTYVFRFWF